MKERKYKLVILSLAGFGDTLSLITRIPAMLEQHPEHQPVFYLGGFGKAPLLSKEQLEREGYKANIIKNLTYHNQLGKMCEFIKEKIVGENDLFLDASFCNEIFKNQEPPFYEYAMQIPYEYKTNKQVDMADSHFFKKFVAIHPLTKSGNAEGFESDVEKGRFWNRDQWKQLCVLLIDSGYTPAFVGYGDEDWGLIEEIFEEYGDTDKVLDARMGVEETINFLQQCVAGVFCNSWDWEVTARAGIPTFSFYTKNHFFIQNHVPHGPSKFWDNTYIETSTAVNYEQVWDRVSYMIENKKRPDCKYSVCMITYNDEECVRDTMENVTPYITDDFVITDGGSTDETISIIEEYDTNLIHRKWADDFSEQKNNSLDHATNKWRVWIDADETYEHIFWNQLPWYINDAEKYDIGCVNVPRINTITNLSNIDLQEYASQVGWNLSFFNWVNYPDSQQRIFTNDCKFFGRTHERIVGANKEGLLTGVHCIHPKTKDRQDKGIKREQDQYIIEAKKISENIATSNVLNKPIVVHYVHHVALGGTSKVLQLLGTQFRKDTNFHHVLAYKLHGPNERISLFEKSFGRENIIPIASYPEFFEVIKELKPFIMHRQTSGQTEFPFWPELKQFTKHLITTSIFAGIDRLIESDITIYISNYMYHYAGGFGGSFNTNGSHNGQLGKNVRIIGIPIEAPHTKEDFREELGISKDAFVFGRLGRDADSIFDPINIISYAMIETDDTHFVALSPSQSLKDKVIECGIKNISYIDTTLDDVRISKFYNTIDVLAHSRKDGECNPGNIHESFAHGKPAISHYAIPYNGHIQEVGNCGFVVNKVIPFCNVWQGGNPASIIDVMEYSRGLNMDNFTPQDEKNAIKANVKEYARIMQAFIDGDIDYDTLSKNCLEDWRNNCHPELIAQQHIDLYKELL